MTFIFDDGDEIVRQLAKLEELSDHIIVPD